MKKLQEQKLQTIVMFHLILTTSVALIFISALSYAYFSKLHIDEARKKTGDVLQASCVSLNTNLSSIMQSVSSFMGDKNVINTILHISRGNEEEYINDYNNMQDAIHMLSRSNDIIDSVLLIGKNKEVFCASTYGMQVDLKPLDTWDYSDTSGMLWLSSRLGPLSAYREVIPVLIPFKRTAINQGIMVSPSHDEALVTLFLFLDTQKINNILSQLNSNPSAALYMTDEFGQSLTQNSPIQIPNLPAHPDGISYEYVDNNKEIYYVESQSIGISNLQLVSIISKSQLLSGLSSIRLFTAMAWIISLILTTFMARYISRSIAKPVHSLIATVHSIKTGNYIEPENLNFQNEVGQFSQALDTMYHTITQQIEQIKKQEREHAEMKVALLTTQLNPHFLYNTLECIQLEISKQHNENAIQMTQHLASYMRSTLNLCKKKVSVQEEINHILQYLEIFNQRSNLKIDFRWYVDEEVELIDLPPNILQPLVENSIRHGFCDSASTDMPLFPYISIIFSHTADGFLLTVEDNGKGIDTKAAKNVINQDHYEVGHVGLYNVCQRLRIFYGTDVTASFTSIPFYQNQVIFTVPVAPLS